MWCSQHFPLCRGMSGVGHALEDQVGKLPNSPSYAHHEALLLLAITYDVLRVVI